MKETYFSRTESDKELISIIKQKSHTLQNEILTPEGKFDLLTEIQSAQNEINFRMTSKTSRSTIFLTWITIGLTIVTIILSGLTMYLEWSSKNCNPNYSKDQTNLLKSILIELKNGD